MTFQKKHYDLFCFFNKIILCSFRCLVPEFIYHQYGICRMYFPKKIQRISVLPFRAFILPAKPSLIKTIAIFFQNIKFCKTQNRLKSRNILYISHIFVRGFLPFWLSNLIFGGIPKDTKKPSDSQRFVYELVG